MTSIHVNTKNKFFISFFGILIVFILASTISTSLLYLNSIEHNITDLHNQYNENLLHQSKSSIESFYESLLDINSQIYSNDSVLALMRSSTPLTSRQHIYLQDWLTQISNTSEIIHSASLYVHRFGKIYDTNYGYCHYLDFPDTEWIDYGGQGSYKKVFIIDKRELKASHYVDDMNIDVLSIIYTLPYSSNYSNKIIINVDTKLLHDEMISRLEDPTGITFAIINEDNRIILGDDHDPLLNELINSKKLTYTNDKQQLNTTYEGHNVQINVLPSGLFSWDFIWMDARDNMNTEFDSIKKLLTMGSLTILLMFIFTAIYVSKKATKPMDELLGNMPTDHKSFNFLTDFRDAIQSTINDNVLMNEKLKKTSPIYKERILYDLLTNTKVDTDATLSRLEDFKIQFLHPYFFVINIEIVNMYHLKDMNINLSTVKNTLSDIVLTKFTKDNIECQVVHMDCGNMAIIVNTYMDDFTHEKEVLTQIANKTITANDDNINIISAYGISQKSSDFHHLPTLYLQSTQALHQRNLNDRNSLIFIDEAIDQTSDQYYIHNLDVVFENNLLNGNKEACLTQINKALDKINTAEQVSKTEFEQFVLHVLSNALRVSLKTRINIANNSYLKQDIWHLTLSIKTIYAARSVLSDIITYVCDEINKLHSDNEHMHLNSILNYIDLHYTENISMDMLSEAINLSSSYIYKILKENNKTFTEIVTEKRLQSACDLLKTGNKVKDIAEEVGFSNAKYFIYVFKKNLGMTPSQYKKTLLF